MGKKDKIVLTRFSVMKWLLTSEDEWYKAAYYDGGRGVYYDYPTSSDSLPGRDMTEATNPGDNANHFGNPWPIDSPHYTTVPGEFELSDSPYGTFDQGGNVWEWNETFSGAQLCLRGSSWANSVHYMHASYRTFDYPGGGNSDYGFRVARVPEPATLSLLALGGLAALRRRSPGRRRLIRRRRRRACK